jgi:hypothetical protein
MNSGQTRGDAVVASTNDANQPGTTGGAPRRISAVTLAAASRVSLFHAEARAARAAQQLHADTGQAAA